MATESHSVEFAGGNRGKRRHICAFFNSADEEHRVLRSFFKEGFDRGDKAFHIVNPELRENYLKQIAEPEINTQVAWDLLQLEERPWQDAPLRGGRFDQETWLASFEQVLQSGPAAGHAQTRFLTHMEWALVDLPGVEDLIEVETRVHYGVPKYHHIVICGYD